MRGRQLAALACVVTLAGCSADRSPTQPPAPGPAPAASTAPVSRTPAAVASSAAPAAGPAAGRTPASPRPTAAPVDTPYTVRGLVLVNRQHPLSAAYVPASATSDPDGLAPELRSALTRLMADAKKAGYTIRVRSGYRSYATQQASYRNALSKYGPDLANRQFARPGTSEHQTGLAADLTDEKGALGYDFKKLPHAAWVAEHAADYGLIVRYPAGAEAITGIDWEAWHVRYVGVEVAREMAKTPGLTLEEYLGEA